jgi:GNAT superfamily N-acetyltransferase
MSIESKTGEYQIERLSNQNLADVDRLHAAVYRKTPAVNFFSLKYETAFTGIKHIGFIAYNSQKLAVAFYAVIPCFIYFDKKMILSAQSADTMTHPDHRNKGLFTALAQLTFALCRREGIQLLFGFPNQNSLPGFINKLGWEKTETMSCFIIPASKFWWDRVFNKLKFLNGLYTRYQQRQIKKYTTSQLGIANSMFTDGLCGVNRDEQFLEYKRYSNTHVIKIGEATAWVKIGRVFLIGDILAEPDEFDELITGLIKLAQKLGIKEVHFHISPDTTLYRLFLGRFDAIPSFPVICKNLGADVQLNKIKFTSADIDTF